MKNIKFKSKVIDGLTYSRINSNKGPNNYKNYLLSFIDDKHKESYSAEDVEKLAILEIVDFESEERRIAAKKRKDEWDMNKFGRTF